LSLAEENLHRKFSLFVENGEFSPGNEVTGTKGIMSAFCEEKRARPSAVRSGRKLTATLDFIRYEFNFFNMLLLRDFIDVNRSF